MRRRCRTALAGLGVAAALAAGAAAAAGGGALQFVALGDMPYGHEAVTGGAYRELIDIVNALRLPLALHVGDFKDGITACTDELYQRQYAYFQRFEAALVYTPGDNDWIDCERTGEDPLERLQALRARFFAGTQSLGRHPVALEHQGDRMPEHARLRENVRWWMGDVLFATFHTVGPYNGVDADTAALRDEHRTREAANVAWLRSAFELAAQRGARALVLATQGDALTRSHRGEPWRIRKGFEGSFAQALLPLARTHRLPVLLVHGDSHQFRFDRPFAEPDGRPVGRLWRLEVFGDPQMHAVQVAVQPGGTDPPFTATPIWNPMSPDPRH